MSRHRQQHRRASSRHRQPRWLPPPSPPSASARGLRKLEREQLAMVRQPHLPVPFLAHAASKGPLGVWHVPAPGRKCTCRAAGAAKHGGAGCRRRSHPHCHPRSRCCFHQTSCACERCSTCSTCAFPSPRCPPHLLPTSLCASGVASGSLPPHSAGSAAESAPNTQGHGHRTVDWACCHLVGRQQLLHR